MKMVDAKKTTGQTGSVSGVRINRTGRRTYTPDYKRDLVRQSSEPGVSVAAIAMQNGINANSCGDGLFAGADASSKRKRAAAATIEIELYVARIHLRGGVDADALRSVLDVLAQR